MQAKSRSKSPESSSGVISPASFRRGGAQAARSKSPTPLPTGVISPTDAGQSTSADDPTEVPYSKREHLNAFYMKAKARKWP